MNAMTKTLTFAAAALALSACTGKVATAALRTKAIAIAQGTANVKSVPATGLVVN